MTTPTPEPARAEPVGGEPEDFLRPNTISLGGRTLKIAGSSIGGDGEFYDYAVRLTPEEIVALAPASDAGLAEVERLVDTCSWLAWEGLTGDHPNYLAAKATVLSAIAALRADNDRLRADAAGRGEGVFGPERHMDEVDAAREAFGWLEELALKLPRIANEQITIEREDAGVRVYWRENKPHAVMLTIRDGLNFTFGMGFNLARIAAAPAPATDGTGGRSDG